MAILREELDKTSKEEPNETRTDIGGSRQVDSSGNRQVDSGGSQDQAIDQEKLNSPDGDAIGPQASKDDPLRGLPTPAQPLEPQLNAITAPSAQVLSA